MKRCRLFIITGIDGSGKTTLATILVRYFKSRGYRTRYVWIKSLHTLAFLIAGLFKFVGRYRRLQNPNNIAISRFEPSEYASVSRVWPFIEFISVLPWVILKVNLAKLLGFVVVTDRYLIDNIVSVSIRSKDLLFADSFLGRLLLRMIPNSAAIIHLDVDMDTVLRRRSDIEYTTEEIRHQITLYRQLAEKMKACTVNTTMLNIKETKAVIFDKLNLQQY